VKAKTIDKISNEVYRKHPDLKGVKPKVTPREGVKSSDTLLIYQKKVIRKRSPDRVENPSTALCGPWQMSPVRLRRFPLRNRAEVPI
jgi:hypothetical protein